MPDRKTEEPESRYGIIEEDGTLREFSSFEEFVNAAELLASAGDKAATPSARAAAPIPTGYSDLYLSDKCYGQPWRVTPAHGVVNLGPWDNLLGSVFVCGYLYLFEQAGGQGDHRVRYGLSPGRCHDVRNLFTGGVSSVLHWR
jgi:hypothetical protein